jgi:hypothetical protein
MGIEEQKLAEFKCLRDEILIFYTRSNTRLIVCWTGISLIFAAAATSKIPELSIVSIILVASAWIDDSHNTQNMFRMSSYITEFHESTLPGLRWHIAFSQAQQKVGYYSGIRGFYIACFQPTQSRLWFVSLLRSCFIQPYPPL